MDMRKLDRQIQRRIAPVINALSHNPRPTNSRKLVGKESYRIRVGDYRILYDIEDDVLVILVVKIAHRREVYR